MHPASPRHLLRKLSALGLSALIVLTGCSSSDGGAGAGEGDSWTRGGSTVEEADDSPVEAPTGAGIVQDMWVYEKVAVLPAGGNEIDLTSDIVAWVSDQDVDETVTLGDGLEFHRYEALAAELVRDGEPRDDVTMTAGLVESEEGRAIAVLATPVDPSSAPIGFEDRIRIDLSFLGDRLAAGDPLIVDHTFLQAFHHPSNGDGAASEGAASALELLQERADAGEVRYLGTADGDQQIYTGEIGVVVDPASRGDGGRMGIRSLSSAQSGEARYSGEMPAKAQPMLDGLERGIRKCGRKGGFGTACVRRYMKSMEAGARDSMALIDCNLMPSAESCDIEPEPDPEPEPELPVPTTTAPERPRPPRDCGVGGGVPDADGSCPRPPGPTGPSGPKKKPRCVVFCSRVFGEPHLQTYDGTQYDMQGVGEFVATRSEDLEVQIRTRAFGQSASAISAVAIGFDGHQVMVSAGEVIVDGERLSEAELATEVAVGDGALIRFGPIVEVISPSGDLVEVTDTTAWLDLWVDLADGDQDRVGLLGDTDGDASNDLRTADGQVMAPPLDFEDLYDVFAESWRVTDDTSLFHYADGEDTSTFTDRDFPAAPLTLDSLPAADRAWAERLCRAAGIEDPSAFDDCVIDLAVTGDLAALRSARRADTISGIFDGRFDETGASPADRASYDADEASDEEASEVPVEHRGVPAWQLTASQLRAGDEDHSRMTCPAGGTPHPVWGSDVYSDDSSVCTAAVHVGIVTFESGGEVLIDHLPGRDSYDGVVRNGVSTSSWDRWPGSFAFVGATGRHIRGG